MNLCNSQIRWFFLSGIIILADFISKWLASSTLSYAQPALVLPFFNLTLLHNYGAAFSFLSDPDSLWQVVFLAIIAIIVSLGIIIWLLKLPRKNNNLMGSGLSLVLGGALGNLYDRLTHGYVVDFLDFYIGAYHWPAFNIADSAICIGAGIVILKSFIHRKRN